MLLLSCSSKAEVVCGFASCFLCFPRMETLLAPILWFHKLVASVGGVSRVCYLFMFLVFSRLEVFMVPRRSVFCVPQGQRRHSVLLFYNTIPFLTLEAFSVLRTSMLSGLVRLKALAERKRVRKKEREAAARLRSRVAMGMENTAVDLPNEEGVFSLASVKVTLVEMK